MAADNRDHVENYALACSTATAQRAWTWGTCTVRSMELILEAAELMRSYSEDHAWRSTVVINQAGITKGMYVVADMRAQHRVMAAELENLGARIEAWNFNPYYLDYTGECDCRESKPGMLLRAMRNFCADPSGCIMYGGFDKDCLFAEVAGAVFRQVG